MCIYIFIYQLFIDVRCQQGCRTEPDFGQAVPPCTQSDYLYALLQDLSLRLLDPQLYMLLQLGNIDQPSLFSNNPKFMTCRTFVSFIFIHVLDNKTHFPFSLPSSVFFVKEICLWGRIDPPPSPCPVVVLRSYSLTGSTCTNYNCTHDLVPWVYMERHLWV